MEEGEVDLEGIVVFVMKQKSCYDSCLIFEYVINYSTHLKYVLIISDLVVQWEKTHLLQEIPGEMGQLLKIIIMGTYMLVCISLYSSVVVVGTYMLVCLVCISLYSSVVIVATYMLVVSVYIIIF